MQNTSTSQIASPPTSAAQSILRFYEAEAEYSSTRNAKSRIALLETVHPEIVLHQPSSLPYGGRFAGRASFGDWLDRFMDTWEDVTPVDPATIECGADTLVITVTMQAVARSTHRAISMPMCQIIRFAEGLPIEWRNFAWDTKAMSDALGV